MRQVMVIGWIFASTLLATAAHADGDAGEPVLPISALSPTPVGEPLDLNEVRAAMRRLEAVGWSAPALELTEEGLANAFVEGEPLPREIKPLSASLLVVPHSDPLPGGAPPRDCRDVLTERRAVHAWVLRVRELTTWIERALDRLMPRCRSACDTSTLTAPLGELHTLVEKLRVYSAREEAALPDRLITYWFYLDTPPGRRLRNQGWYPVGKTTIQRVRYFKSPWEEGPNFGLGQEGRMGEAPRTQPDGTWIIRRALTATHACVLGQVFRVEFLSPFQLFPSGQTPLADADGSAQLDPQFGVSNFQIEAVSL